MTLGPDAAIGPYRVIRLLGAGEMGEVYRAHDARLDRDVAIKIVADRVARDPDMVARFEREVRAVAALSHPNVLGIYDVGRTPELLYAVMELVPGVTLRERMAASPLPHQVVIDIALQIARGLEAAHAKQIVHRDLKPDNVLVSDEGQVKILDFGIAKVDPLGIGGERETMYNTAPGIVLGTLAYMAPEQLRGQAVDHRADIFAFGAIVYEMLAGEPPFVRPTSAETIAALIAPDPADPAKIAAMPEPLATLVTSCLAKPVAERLASIREAIDVLDGLGETGDVRQMPGPRVAAPAAAARSVAVLPFADMSPQKDQDYFCEGMADEIITALARVPGLRVVARTSAFRFKGRTEDVRDIGRALGVTTVLEGSVRAAGSRLRITAQLINAVDGYQLWSERFDRESTDVFAVQDEIARTVARTLTDTLAGAYRTLEQAARPAHFDAYSAYLKGRQQWSRRTETGLVRSVDYFNDAVGIDAAYAPAWAALADSYVTLAIYGVRAPADVMLLAREAATRALAISPQQASAHASIGCVESLHDWAWDRADQSFARALAIDPNLAIAAQWRAMHVLLPQGRFEEALAALARAQELDPIAPAITASQALCRALAGQTDRALADLDRAIQIDPDTPLLHFFRGLILADAGNHVPALAAFEASGRDGGRRPELIGALGYTHARAGHADAARAALQELAALDRTRYVSPVAVAQVQAGLGDLDAANDALTRAADLRATDLVWLGVRPAFQPLRPTPRFQAIVARLGLTVRV